VVKTVTFSEQGI